MQRRTGAERMMRCTGGGVAYALWKLDCYLDLRYVAVNLLNGGGWTKPTSHRLRATSSFPPVFACIVFQRPRRTIASCFPSASNSRRSPLNATRRVATLRGFLELSGNISHWDAGTWPAAIKLAHLRARIIKLDKFY